MFGALGRRWYLFGAQAVSVHGTPRLTGDIDVTLDLGDLPLPALIEAFSNAGFSSRVADPNAFALQTRVLPMVHQATSIPVDVILAGSGLEERFLARTILVLLAGTPIPVLSPEDLILGKLLAGRAKDLEDVTGIIKQQASLDIAYIRKTLSELDEALSRADLLRAFDDARTIIR